MSFIVHIGNVSLADQKHPRNGRIFKMITSAGTQTKKGSIIESLINVSVGYFVAVASQIIIFPVFNINVPLTVNLLIGLFFTIISIIRSYTLRRLFNKYNF